MPKITEFLDQPKLTKDEMETAVKLAIRRAKDPIFVLLCLRQLKRSEHDVGWIALCRATDYLRWQRGECDRYPNGSKTETWTDAEVKSGCAAYGVNDNA